MCCLFLPRWKWKLLDGKKEQQARDENGRWDIGGGAVEFGDTIESTIKKEIIEEYCTEVLSYDFLGFRDVHRSHNGKNTHWVALDFKVLIDPSNVKIGEPDKFDDIGWFKLNKLPKNCHSQFPVFLDLHKDKLLKK